MAKFHQVIDLLERRILRGDYSLKGVPAERILADEIGVSRMTARKAIQAVIDKGLLTRQPNGRLQVATASDGKAHYQIAFLAPAWSSNSWDHWRRILERTAAQFDATIRPVDYVHWDDPVVSETLEGFDGVFLMTMAESMPDGLLAKLKSRQTPVVVLDTDASAWGIPSVHFFPAVFVQRVLDHLAELGHRSVDCLNTQPVDGNINERIEQWNLWRAAHNCAGNLINDPVEPYELTVVHAHRVLTNLMRSNRLRSTALLCTTEATAIGAMRAITDQGLKVGRDISVCAVDDDGLAQYLTPSLTALKMPQVDAYFSVCLKWMMGGGKQWAGSLCLRPATIELFKGESTGRARDK